MKTKYGQLTRQRKAQEAREKHTWHNCKPTLTQIRKNKENGINSFEEHELSVAVRRYTEILDGLSDMYFFVAGEPLSAFRDMNAAPPSDLELSINSDKFKGLVNLAQSALEAYLDVIQKQSLFERTILYSNVAKDILAYLNASDFSNILDKIEYFYRAAKRNGYNAF